MSPSHRSRLWLELAVLYVLTPLAIALAVRFTAIPLVLLLAPVLALAVFLLTRDEGFSWRRLAGTGTSQRQLLQILGLFAVLGVALTVFARVYLPGYFLSFPRTHPGVWIAVMVFYPLISVTAQEVMFRVLFHHRYSALFAGSMAAAVIVNAALFAFAHIVFASWVTVLVSFAGGLIFAWRYFTTQSFWTVVLEHSLYGNLIFTVGLGRYFLAGVPFT